MSKTKIVVAFALSFVGFVVGAAPGCGGGSSSPNAVDVCNKGCDKAGMCTPDAGALGAVIVSTCKSSCSSANSGSCANASAVIDFYNNCLAMDCTGFLSCVQSPTRPTCQGGGGGTSGGGGATGSGGTTGSAGHAGTNGTAGTTGSAGRAGTGTAGTTGFGGFGGLGNGGFGGTISLGDAGVTSCSNCAKASACCTAVQTQLGQSTASCASQTETACNALSGTAQQNAAATCYATIATGTVLGIAACM
jgi:hypothetical protein